MQTFRRYVGGIALWTILFPVGLFLTALLVFTFDFQWFYDSHPLLYSSLRNLFYNFKDRLPLIFPIGFLIWLAGDLFLTYRLIRKVFVYLDVLSCASGDLLDPSVESIKLPPELSEIQQQMNHLKQQAERNEQLAREAEQRKNDLIVYLAHDLKTPLTSVIGYLNLLQDEPQISPKLRAKYTGIALDKAERLEELINEFFEITRFNLTHLELDLETIDLTRMLEQITFEFNPILAQKGLCWDLHLQPDVLLPCDPDKLERVFDNLFCNAVNYSSPQQPIQVTLQAQNDQAVIQVENHGKTIPPEKLARIFDQFFRLDPSRASSTGGSGLGLAIAKQITELHGGSIQAESANESIRFTVVLPLKSS